MPRPASCQPNGTSQEALQYEIEELKQKDLALDQETAQLLSEYVLGELSVRCDASIIFVLKKPSGLGLRAKSRPLTPPFLSWRCATLITALF